MDESAFLEVRSLVDLGHPGLRSRSRHLEQPRRCPWSGFAQGSTHDATPREQPHRADAASGPIIAGYSVGATALGLPATRTLPAWNAALELTALANGAGELDEHHPLEAALFRYGETARTWH